MGFGAGFGKAFSEAHDKTAPVATAGTFDMLKEKIKANNETATTNNFIDMKIAQKIEEDRKKGIPEAQTKEDIKPWEKAKGLGLKADHLKVLFPDELTKAIQEQTLQQKTQMNQEATLPTGITPLGVDATPEEKGAFLDQLTPQMAEVVQGIADYTLDPTKVSSMRTGERSAIMAAAKMYDPTFDMKKYPAQQNYIKQLSSTQNGTVGAKVNSANTLISHLDLLDRQVDKLKNTNLKPTNAIINLAKDLSGDPSITDFKQAKAVVDSELEVLLTNVGATQQGLEARRALLSENAGYEQMKSSIKTIGHILQARTKPLEQQYTELFGKDPGDKIIHTDSKAILERLYGGGSSSKKSHASLWS